MHEDKKQRRHWATEVAVDGYHNQRVDNSIVVDEQVVGII